MIRNLLNLRNKIFIIAIWLLLGGMEPTIAIFRRNLVFQPSGDLMKRFEGIDYTNTKDYNNYADYKVRLFQIDF